MYGNQFSLKVVNESIFNAPKSVSKYVHTHTKYISVKSIHSSPRTQSKLIITICYTYIVTTDS